MDEKTKNINDPNNPVILFIPEAGIYPFIRGLSVLGDSIVKQGGKVFVTYDPGIMLRSPIMVKHKMPVNASLEQRAEICKKNTEILKKVLSKYKFSPIDISELVDEKLMQEIESLVADKNNDLENIIYRGFPVGKVAQYDFMLETKFPYSPILSNERKALYSAYIKNTALTIAITDRICQKHKPSLLVTFNEYAQSQAVRYSADTHNISRMALTYPVHFNIDASRFLIWKSTFSLFFYLHCQKWNDIKDIPIVPQYIKECWDDVVFRLFGAGGSHIFSTRKEGDPANVFNKLKLDPKKKTVVAYSSSRDERPGLDTIMKVWGEDSKVVDAFQNQTEWLSVLREYAAKRDDIQIVVRIHPREGKRQFGFDSQHLKQLKEKFTENASNFIIVWPDDPISSYDLVELADICLIAWSSMGHEATRLGVPVLSYASNLTYVDDDFMQVATTPEEYLKKLDYIIDMKYAWRHLVKAVRFYHWRTFIPSLDLGETVPVDFGDDTIWPEAPESMVPVINDILSGKQDLISYNIKKWQDSLNDDSLKEESEAMRKGIRYFLDKIFYPPAAPKNNFLTKLYKRVLYKLIRIWHRLSWNRKYPTKKKEYDFTDYKLEYYDNKSRAEEFRLRTEGDKNLRVIIADGLYAVLAHNGKLSRRMSPMVIKLAKMHYESREY
ncbi:MAG: hypothetical protein AAB837_01250 [Patescibacteria group bacterium]